MAANLMDIRGLAAYHAKEVCSNAESWTGFLDTVAQFYRYPFFDTLLIHAQRPDATACASMAEWNQKINRWVNRGAKGIALIDDSGQKLRLRYVFDIKDTHPIQGAKRVNLWQMNRKMETEIKKHLKEVYGLSFDNREPMPKVIQMLSKALTGENIRQAMYELSKNKDNSYLSTMGDETLLKVFTKLIETSISYVLMKRCGYHPFEHLDMSDLDFIRMFDDINVLPYLGEAIHTIIEPVLMDIGREVADINRKEYLRQKERAGVEGQMELKIDGKNVIFEMKKEQDTEHIKEDAYGKQHEYRLSAEHGLQLSEPDTDGERDKDTERYKHIDGGVEELPEGKTPDLLLDPDADREAARGEVITTILLPALPSPEEQQALIEKERETKQEQTKKKAKRKTTTKDTPSKHRTSVQKRLKEKQVEVDTINKERGRKPSRTPEKDMVI